MSKANLLLVAAAVLATAAGAPPSSAQSPMSVSTTDFVQAAGASDEYEILASRVALIESQDSRVRTFAQQMIQDHSMTRQTLQQAALSSGLPPPVGLSDDGQRFLSQLQSLSGPEFDKAYIRQQVLAHQQALTVEQSYAASGQDPAVRQAAQSAVPIIQRHLAMAQQMRASASPS